MTALVATSARQRAGPAPPDFGRREPWPHSPVSAPMAPAEEYPPEPDNDPPDTRWLELSPALSPFVRLGLRLYQGERQLVFRIVREPADAEAYAEVVGETPPMRELAQTITDVCDFFDACAYGVTPESR